MSTEIRLRPGVPDDDNRDYLPESLKGSDIVVNENGNNSIPYNFRLQEFHEELNRPGIQESWYEYVPESYDGSKPVPLVIGCHGGLMTGWGHSVYTSWTMVADREGFICLFPDATQGKIWTVEKIFDKPKGDEIFIPEIPDDIHENEDCNMILTLIGRMKQKYNIDPGRIFMQGMSMGNLMTHQFSRYYGNLLAGAAGSACSTYGKALFDRDFNFLNQGGPLAVWQSRPEKNGVPAGSQDEESRTNRFNRYYWLKINECDTVPKISIVGEDNFAFYTGKKANMVFLDIKNRDHGQTLDEAFLYWDYFFSGIHREPDGRIVQEETKLSREGDSFAAAFTEGAAKVWWHNSVCELSQAPLKWQKLKYHGLNGGQKVRGEYLMVPVKFLAELAGAAYQPSEDTLTAEVMLPDGRELQFARGSIGCMIDDTMRSMYCETLHRNGELLVSAEWFCRYLLNLTVTECNGVVYVTDHFAQLSYFMADLLKDLLKDQADMESYERFMIEDVTAMERNQ